MPSNSNSGRATQGVVVESTTRNAKEIFDLLSTPVLFIKVYNMAQDDPEVDYIFRMDSEGDWDLWTADIDRELVRSSRRRVTTPTWVKSLKMYAEVGGYAFPVWILLNKDLEAVSIVNT